MAGMPGRSGGHNRLTPDVHKIVGTFRKDRHGPQPVPPQTSALMSPADRRRTLKGLSPAARHQAVALLSAFESWDVSSLATLRAYCLSCERLETFQVDKVKSLDLYREIRANVLLLKTLNFEKAK